MTATRLTCLCLLFFGALCGQPLDVMFAVETSPGTEQAIALIRPRVLAEDDRAGVIGFFRDAYLLQPLTDDRDEVAAGLQRVGTRVGGAFGGPGRSGLDASFTVDLVAALRKAADEFGQRGADERRRAIVLLSAGDDPNLGRNLETLGSVLSGVAARLYAVVVQRTEMPGADPFPRNGAPRFPVPAPVVTSQFLSQLAEISGGRLYPRNWDLKKILAEARTD